MPRADRRTDLSPGRRPAAGARANRARPGTPPTAQLTPASPKSHRSGGVRRQWSRHPVRAGECLIRPTSAHSSEPLRLVDPVVCYAAQGAFGVPAKQMSTVNATAIGSS